MIDKVETELTERANELTPTQIARMCHIVSIFTVKYNAVPENDEFLASLDLSQRHTLSMSLFMSELAS